MSTRCAATATPSPICSEGGRHTRASGIGKRGQHAVAGGEIAILVDRRHTDMLSAGREVCPQAAPHHVGIAPQDHRIDETVISLGEGRRLRGVSVQPRLQAGLCCIVHPFCFSSALLSSELLERSSKRSAPLARSCPVLLSVFASSLEVASRKPSAACFPAFDDFRSLFI